MSKRYYLCDVLGDGTVDSPVRPVIDDLGVPNVSVILTDPATGQPARPWCLALVATDNHARIAAAKGVDPLPDVSLDTQANSVDRSKMAAATAALQRRGAAVPSFAPGDGYRNLIRGIGRQLQPEFSEDNFDVIDAS